MGLVFLCGLPGSGKTTLGKAVSERLGFPFIDLDEEIEQECGKSIGEIFDQDGEALFRVLESQALTRACAHGKALVALGAGALENEENLASVLGSGKLIFLRVSPAVIAERSANWITRPLFKGCELIEQVVNKLNDLLFRRETNYLKANFILDVLSNESVDETAERLAAQLK